MSPSQSEAEFWDRANFRLVDSLNEEMWVQSIALQYEIQSPRCLVQPGSIGPQQAMLELEPETVLPWVPDIVGDDAEGERVVLIFGAAYAGFISEYSSRGHCLPLRDYVNVAKHNDKGGWIEFQRLFLSKVVAPDRSYYGKLASFLESRGIAPKRIILSDLCPNSFVKRGTTTSNIRKDSSSQPDKERAAAFCKYVEHPTVENWTWKRIKSSRTKRVIALGHIAEHGLLRLFARNGASIRCGVEEWKRADQQVTWVYRYADPNRKLDYWLDSGRWWVVSVEWGDVRLLPIYHPSARGGLFGHLSADHDFFA